MSARKKKTTRKKTSARARTRKTIDAGLRDLEKRLPANLRGPVRDLRANLKALQKQVDKTRADREERWRRLEAQIRRDAASALRRLEKAVAGSTKKVAPKKKKAARKKTARKKTATKKTARRKTTRKPARKKAGRKKTTRR
jgi:histone H1/5